MIDNEHVMVTVRDSYIYQIRRKIQIIAFKILGPECMARFYYRIVMHKKLNLKSPLTFTEKINWYKLFYCPKNELIVQCSDKYQVRAFLEKLDLSEYLSHIIGVWDNPSDINFESLPQKFALKNSNGCGYNIICDNKDYLNEKMAKKILIKWLKEPFGCYNVEPHYNIGPKKIICEEYVESDKLLPIDYKIHCMNGCPRVIQVCDDRTNHKTKYQYFDIDGNPLKYGLHQDIEKLSVDMEMKEKMLDICKIVSAFFPYVRVDFFIYKNRLQISELTFTPSAGFKPDLNYGDGDIEMGRMLVLPCD